ncbi:Neural-cadherin-like 10, partial [Homarus americanus]
GGGSEAPLGRVYVEDPDDWDLADKTFSWQGSPHPVFSLNTQTGDIFASSQVRAGRYELQFTVSDHLWGQRDVAANVTVTVKVLTPDALAHAAPVTLTPTTPAHLTRGWTPEHGGGGLGRVIQGVLRVVGEAAHTVEVVSVYTHPDPTHLDDAHLDHNDAGHTHPYHTPGSASIFTNTPTRSQHWMTHAPSACVWVNVRESQGGFMDPIKLQGLLALRSHQVEAATNLTVVAEAPSSGGSGGGATNTQHYLTFPSLLHDGGPPDPSSAAYRASTTLPLQVVDINSTSLVTPRLTRAHVCYAHDLETCTPTSCLNGGRCVGSLTGNRCVCPGGSWGARCKVLGRTFSGAGWAWVRPLPSCLPTTISLKLLTRRPHALLLYSGPLAPAPPLPNLPTTPMLALQVWRGRPQLLLEGGAGAVKLEVNTTVNDGDWHTLHLYLHPHGVALMVDVCGHSRGWDNDTLDDSDCVARASWPNPEGVGAWIGSGPLQVGGLAHTAPSPAHHGWSEAPTPRPLDGCVSHLTVNSQLVDLGEPAYSLGSEGGCHLQEAACPGSCGHRGQCVGGLNHPDCECEPGWAGPSCASPTVPATLGSASYVRLTLSFIPGPRVVTAQLRLRTRGARHGLLLHLATQQQLTALTIHLRAGVVCASVTGVARVACVEGRPVGDGAWHTIRAERHGHNLVVSVDDGDGWRRNESLVSLEQPDEEGDVRESPVPLDLGQNEGVTVGGLPELVGVNIVNVLDDLQESCIDDVRVSGRQLPLPPAVNGTSWGQVTTWQNVESGCNASDACLNTTCDAPLSCVSTWGATTCSCGSGRQLVGRSCQDLDECVWRPCLHGGTCYNLRPGFQCVCGPGHAGDHCQWNNLATAGHPLTAPVAIATVAVSLLLLVVVGVVLSVRLRRQWFTRGPRARQGEAGGQEGTVLEMKDGVESDAQVLQADHHQALLHCLRLPLPHHHTSSSSQDKEESVPVSHNTPYTGDAPVTTSVPVTTIVPVSVGVPMTASVRVRVTAGVVGLDPLPAKDDLRAYAYEGLREEQFDTENIQSLAPEFLEVMDLLRNLPEATKSPSLLPKLKEQKARRRRSSVESTLVKSSKLLPRAALTSLLKHAHPPIYPTTHPPIYPTTHTPIYPTTHTPIYPTTHTPIYPTTHPTQLYDDLVGRLNNVIYKQNCDDDDDNNKSP